MIKLYSVFILFLLVGCKTIKPEPACCTQEEIQKPLETEPDTARVDSWVGTYKGLIPCDSCDGMQVSLTLREDENYRLEIDYVGTDSSLVRDFFII